jgi:hypothetical protein
VVTGPRDWRLQHLPKVTAPAKPSELPVSERTGYEQPGSRIPRAYKPQAADQQQCRAVNHELRRVWGSRGQQRESRAASGHKKMSALSGPQTHSQKPTMQQRAAIAPSNAPALPECVAWRLRARHARRGASRAIWRTQHRARAPQPVYAAQAPESPHRKRKHVSIMLLYASTQCGGSRTSLLACGRAQDARAAAPSDVRSSVHASWARRGCVEAAIAQEAADPCEIFWTP